MNTVGDSPAANRDGPGLTVLDLDAAAVAASPFLGFQIGEVPGAHPNDPALRVRVPRQWIISLGTTILIDVDMFADMNPFEEILGEGAMVASVVPSVSAELSERWGRPDLSHFEMPVSGVRVRGGGLEALVWPHGMLIAATDPLATALNLLFADFSPEARRTQVHADPNKLRAALDVLPPMLRREYVPDSAAYLAEAAQQYVEQAHQVALRKQARLNALPRTTLRVVKGEVSPPE